MASTTPTLDQFPEELLERILAHSIDHTHIHAHAPRPAWLRSPTGTQSTRLAPLLVSRQLARICTPLLYHTIHLATPAQAHLLLRTLTAAPSLAAHVRCLSLAGLWRDAAEVMRMCGQGVRVLDVTITNNDEDGHGQGEDVTGLWREALGGMTGVRHLTLRKPNNVYLSLPRPRSIINALASAISGSDGWTQLQTANIAFKLSDDTPTSPVLSPTNIFVPFSLSTPPPPPTTTKSTATNGPVTHLTHALACAPALHTFATHLPSVWNVAILGVSANPRLERIVLYSSSSSASSCIASPYAATQAQAQGIIGTGLFLMEARKHARLGELIRAGTPILRTRARTMGSPCPSPERKEEGREGRGVGLGLGLGIEGVQV
ncbi:hypothetical protein Hypma_006076 [Hypsizygus marmoreus]|uniref:Uncharacterized protein n=1 Tax=Hypsizygus marmoreus TaxID=39966 RepID=A0A369K0F6_HYPMA|nr:hypothetical protein Hypma_006076 [Hypsizygus marmoreus]